VLYFEKRICIKRTFHLEVISIASLEIYSILVPLNAYIGTAEDSWKFSLADLFSASQELQFRLFIGQNLSKNGNSHSLSSQAWEYTQSHLGQIGPLLACKARFVLHFEKKVCVKRTFPLEVISIASLEVYSILVPWKAYIGRPEGSRKSCMTYPFSASRELQFRLFIGQNRSRNGNCGKQNKRPFLKKEKILTLKYKI